MPELKLPLVNPANRKEVLVPTLVKEGTVFRVPREKAAEVAGLVLEAEEKRRRVESIESEK